MSACSSRFPGASNQVLLRWSDPPHSPPREGLVNIIDLRPSEIVINSTFEVCELLEVSVVGIACQEIGIVQSCKSQGSSFLLTIALQPRVVSEYKDPGVLALDDFITEEQEAEILNSLDNLDDPFGERAGDYTHF